MGADSAGIDGWAMCHSNRNAHLTPVHTGTLSSRRRSVFRLLLPSPSLLPSLPRSSPSFPLTRLISSRSHQPGRRRSTPALAAQHGSAWLSRLSTVYRHPRAVRQIRANRVCRHCFCARCCIAAPGRGAVPWPLPICDITSTSIRAQAPQSLSTPRAAKASSSSSPIARGRHISLACQCSFATACGVPPWRRAAGAVRW